MKKMPVMLLCLAISAYAAATFGAVKTGTAHMDANTATTVQAAASSMDAMSVNQLLAAALVAYQQHRLVAPAGDNAFAYYEAALRKLPTNRIARDALREAFPFGVTAVERTIKHHQLDAAQREVDLLAKADPGNYSLTILRAKLPQRHELSLAAAAASWVKVSDGSGKVVYSGTLHAGEQRRIHSSGPLDVVVGNASGVQVTADGKPLPLQPGHHSRVAEFRVFDRPLVALH